MTSLRNNPKDQIVMCMQAPDLNTIDNPSNCVFIALSPELLTGEAISLFAPELLDEYISLQDYDEIRHILIKEWKVFLSKNYGNISLEDYFYYFSLCRTPTLFWSRQIKRIFSKYTPKIIWLPNAILKSDPVVIGGDSSTYEQFLAWSFQKLLIDESVRHRCEIKYFQESHKSARKISYTPKNSLLNKLETIVSRSINALDRILHFMAPFIISTQRAEDKPILISAQISKIKRLIDCLVIQRKKFKILSYDELENKLFVTAGQSNTSFSFELASFSKASISEALEAWLCHLCRYHDCITEDVIDDFLINYKPPMITDGGHDPIIARINRYIAKSNGWKIFVVPEGGINSFSFNKCERFILPSHDNLIRYLSSSFDLQHCVNQGESRSRVQISGYGTALRFFRVYGRFLRFILRLYKARDKTIVFYDHAVFHRENIGIFRTNARPERLLCAEVNGLTSLLDSSRFYLISSERGETSKFRFSAQRSVFLSRLHWSVLAWCADVVVTRESTILLESLKIGRSVVYYDPHSEFPDVYPYLKDLTFKGYRYVSNPEGLVQAINELTSENPDPASFDFYMSDPVYANLLRLL